MGLIVTCWKNRGLLYLFSGLHCILKIWGLNLTVSALGPPCILYTDENCLSVLSYNVQLITINSCVIGNSLTTVPRVSQCGHWWLKRMHNVYNLYQQGQIQEFHFFWLGGGGTMSSLLSDSMS